jgi:TolA-binding protein
MSTQVRKGIEIFSTGTWNKGTFSEADLDAMVESFDALELAGRVPLKLGHEGPDGRLVTGERDKNGNYKDPLSQLSMGWVQRIYRQGNTLYADIEVSDKVAKLIDDKFLKFVSVELYSEVRASRRVFPWVLDAVALLGTDNPAVGILKDIQTLAMSARAPMAHSQHLMFAREGQYSTLIGDRPTMAKEKEEGGGEITLQGLSDQLLKMQQTIVALQGENATLRQEVVKGQQAQNRFTELQQTVQKDRVTNHRQAIKDKLEVAVKAMDITPAARDRFLKTYKVEDDTLVMEIDLNDVGEFIEENPNPKKPTAQKKGFSVKNSDADVPDDIPADQAMTALTFAQLREDGIANPTADQIEAAAVKVMQKNPNAKTRYRSYIDQAHGYDRRNG